MLLKELTATRQTLENICLGMVIKPKAVDVFHCNTTHTKKNKAPKRTIKVFLGAFNFI
jgi:hypothetical protein